MSFDIRTEKGFENANFVLAVHGWKKHKTKFPHAM
jgi:hypothetical protein